MTRKGKIAGALAALGLAAGLTLAGAGTAGADITPPSLQWAEIFNPYLHAQSITLCADDPNGSTSSGTQLDLWRCHGYASNGAMQRWLFVPSRFSQTGRPVYQVYNVAGNLCLTAVDAHPAKPLTLGPCIDNISETWELHTVIGPSGGENFQLEPWPSEDFNTCMSASNFTDSNGTRLVMETCDRYDTSQLWNLG